MLIYEFRRASQQITLITITLNYLFQIPNAAHIKTSLSYDSCQTL